MLHYQNQTKYDFRFIDNTAIPDIVVHKRHLSGDAGSKSTAHPLFPSISKKDKQSMVLVRVYQR